MASVYVSVMPGNAAPDAQDDNYTASFGSNVTGNLISDNGNGFDSDSDGGSLSIIENTIISTQGRTVIVPPTEILLTTLP